MKKLGLIALGAVLLAAAGGFAQAATDEGKRFTIHGEVSFRGEVWNNMFDFTDSADDPTTCDGTVFGGFSQGDHCNDSFDVFPFRVRLAAHGDLGHDISVHGEFQSHGIAGGGPDGTLSEPTNPFFGDGSEDVFNSGVSLYQGWVKITDVGSTVLDLTFGRQEIQFDNSLLYGNEEFYNGRSFDGVMAGWDWDSWGIHGFWARITDFSVAGPTLDPFTDGDNEAAGAHAMFDLGRDGRHHVSGYVFYNEENSVALAASDDMTQLYTFGGVWGWDRDPKESGWDFSGELALQFGDWSCELNPTSCTGTSDESISVSSWVVEGWGGYTWHAANMENRVHGYLLMASGDEDPNDDKWEAFEPLYGDVHDRLGYADLFVPHNLIALSGGWTGTFHEKHSIEASLWMFERAEEDDSVDSTVGGFTLAEAGTDKELGNELDVVYNYDMTANFAFLAGIAMFDPGDGITQTITDPAFPNGDPDADGDEIGWRIITRARARW